VSTAYHDLLELFEDWRRFQPPVLVDGVPDYGPAAMARQQSELSAYRRRLAAIDPSRWPIPQQVDYHIVRAEMNGLDFDHRVLRPWANDPAFYVAVFASESDQPAREGHYARGSLELWDHAWPLDAPSVADIRLRLAAIPPLLEPGATWLGAGATSGPMARVSSGRKAGPSNDSARVSPIRCWPICAETSGKPRRRPSPSPAGSTWRHHRKAGRPGSASTTTTGTC
jgi:hypothetical protein